MFISKRLYARKGFLPGEKPQAKKDKGLMGVTTQSKSHALVLSRIIKKTWVTLTDITVLDKIYWAYTKFGEQKMAGTRYT